MTVLSTLFLVLAILCMVTGVALMMAMAGAVQARGQRINWIFLRLFILKYVGQYREMTIQESGRPGPLFYPFIILMNSALLFTILGLVLRAA
jgi:hypothetical protein